MNVSNTVSVVFMLLVFAVLIQFITNRLKAILGTQVMKYLPADVLAALLGILFAVMFDVDVFAYFGLDTKIPVVGCLISGLIISAGAPAIHELLANIREQRKNLESTK